MADYFKILTGAIAQQGIDDPAAREALYARVRKVLETQLEGLDPEKTGPIADQHRKTLDEAIAKIEAEAGDAVLAASDPAPVEPPAANEPVPEPKAEAPLVSSDDVSKEPVATPETSTPAAPSTGNDVTPPSLPTPSAPTAIPSAGAYVAPPMRPASATAAAPQSRPSQKEMTSQLRSPNASERMGEEPKRSGWRMFSLILVLLVAGIAVLGYWQRDKVEPYAGPLMQVVGDYAAAAKDSIGTMTGLWEPTMSSSAEEPVADEDAIEAEPEATPVPEADAQDQPQSDDAPEIVATSEPETPVQDSAPVTSAPVTSAPETSAPVTSVQSPVDTPSGGEEDVVVAPAQLAPVEPEPVASGPTRPQAFFLIEGNAEAGQEDERLEGSTNWLLVGSGGTLRIEAEMAGTGARLLIDIAKNDDADLPASHTVTYNYTPRETEPDGSIVSFPAFMARIDDTSQSVPLRGAGAPILPNQYLMGLSDKPDDVIFNRNLLKNARWFVIPVVFENERRGLFVLEKGEIGKDAMASAMAAWGETDDPQ